MIDNRGRTYILVITYLYHGYSYWYKLLLLPHQLSTLRVRCKQNKHWQTNRMLSSSETGLEPFPGPKRQAARPNFAPGHTCSLAQHQHCGAASLVSSSDSGLRVERGLDHKDTTITEHAVRGECFPQLSCF